MPKQNKPTSLKIFYVGPLNLKKINYIIYECKIYIYIIYIKLSVHLITGSYIMWMYICNYMCICFTVKPVLKWVKSKR